jgi:ParB-like chromosome segregation protein Spo0J
MVIMAMAFVERSVPLGSIRIENRYRKELGDLSSLMKSIDGVGLINRIILDRDNRLLAGGRRLEACRRLGWEIIPARIVATITDARDALVIERDENTERLPMTFSELESLMNAILQLERVGARGRQAEGRERGRETSKIVKDGLPSFEGKPADQPKRHHGEAATMAGEAVGWSRSKAERAHALGDAARSGSERAQALMEQVDAGEKTINGAYCEYRETVKREVAEPREYEGLSASVQRRGLRQWAGMMRGLESASRGYDALHPDLTGEEVTGWLSDLLAGRRALNVLIQSLKERSSVNT